jgi:glycosyltransferase involved in cell wall biosynthesis
MNEKFPLISVIIPCFNSEKRISECLDSIISQEYPGEKLQIIIVDDDSTDNTVKIVTEKYGCTVIRNGTHNIERGKSLGVEAGNGEYIFLIDDDNRLPHSKWLPTLLNAVISESCVGGQACWFYYDKRDKLPNRYAALFAINDPTVFYLNKRDKLMAVEKTWTLPGEVEKDKDLYYVIKFNEKNLLTIGSQGFLIRRDYLMQATYKPYLYHMDVNMELVLQGLNQYIMLKDSIIHNHSNDVKHFVAKLKRNISLFYSENKYRKYTYNINFRTMIKLGFLMTTFFIPVIDSIKGFIKIHDAAWFLHPPLCFRVALIYTITTINNMIKKTLHNG